MKQLNLVYSVFSVAACLAALMWLALPGVEFYLVPSIFGFISLFVLTCTSDSMRRYDSLVISEIFFNPFIWLSLSFLNIIMMISGFFLFVSSYKGYDIVLVLQTPFLVFAAMVIIPTLLWHVAVSKLTPKPGTMVVDEDDLYYLPGDVLPWLLPRAQIITSETKIPVSVCCYFSASYVTFSRSFCFAPWVFTPEARLKLPGSMNYSTLVKSAKKEFLVSYPDIKVLQDIWKPFWFRNQENTSPYVWNRDTTVSE